MSATTSNENAASTGRGADPHSDSWKERGRFFVELVSDTVDRFGDNEGYRLAASFSYYAVFSIFPLLLLSVTLVGYVVGDSAEVKERLLGAVGGGGSVRDVLQQTLDAMQNSQGARGLSAVVGLVSLLFGASGVFVELSAALNRIWAVKEKKTEGVGAAVKEFIQERLTGFAIVGAIGASLLVSLVASSVLEFVLARTHEQIDLPLWDGIVRASEVGLSLLILTGVFTAAFHFIPQTRPPWRTVIVGAFLTTVLLTALKECFAAYLAKLTSYSAYGVAGGILGLTTWIYLSSMIIFFVAQLTRVRAEKLGMVD